MCRNENNKNEEEAQLKSDLYSRDVFLESYTGARKFANYLAMLNALLFDLLRFCDEGTHANALTHSPKTKSKRKKSHVETFFLHSFVAHAIDIT